MSEPNGQYCPECGAGPNGDGTFRLSCGWPICGDCNTCHERTCKRFEKLGAEWARKRNEIVLGVLTGTV